MTGTYRGLILIAALALAVAQSVVAGEEKVETFRGASDASAAVAVGDDAFIVGDNEINVLKVYRVHDPNTPAAPIASFDLNEFLQVDPARPEGNIEGATSVGDRVYWITSHGRNKDGKFRPGRHRFFATTVRRDGEKIEIKPVGAPCKTLAYAIADDPALKALGLDKALRLDDRLSKAQREELAPTQKGLNIESLAATPDGKTIYIGVRNPMAPGKDGNDLAILIVLTNPAPVVEKGEKLVFTPPILCNLGGMGFRGMEYSPYHKAYFIAAGRSGSGLGGRLYRWSGDANDQPKLVKELDAAAGHFHFESVAAFPRSPRLLLLSDDGTRPVKVSGPGECLSGEYRPDGTCLNKYLLEGNRRTFRAMWVEP